MSNLFDLLANGVVVEKKEIVEGYNAPSVFMEKVKVFFPEEVYNLNPESLLYKMLLALIGDAGIGAIKKAFLSPRLQQSLQGTQFTDIDKLFANVFQLGRLSDEIYTADPFNELLTQSEWEAIRRKDASYKARALDFMRSIHLGNTKEGTKLLGKAATGTDCQVFERYRYLDDLRSDEPIGIPDIGKTLSESEIVIAPETASLSVQNEKRIYDLADELKAANTIVTVSRTDSNLSQITIRSGTASSSYFYVQKFVTGNNILDYASASGYGNNWIETGVEKEAPTPAYHDRSENTTFPSILSVEASSYHIGPFSADQQAVFTHLANIPNDFAVFSPEEAISNVPLNYEVSSPWILRNESKDSLVVNNHYPLAYFADKAFSLAVPNDLFWASQEEIPDVEEYLILDMQSERPVNLIELEICQKPIDIEVEYWDGATFSPVTLRTDVESETKIFYRESVEYSWQPVAIYFEVIQTSKIKIRFKRRLDNFPNPLDIDFPWSVDVRRAKLAYIIMAASDFIADSGSDVLGNVFRTDINEYPYTQAVDGNADTFWQSQANPSPFAVEALYFDVSATNDPVVVDEIYIDPVTPECLMHIYYSTDTTETNWDNKLWSPVPRHYLLTKDTIRLSSPIVAKYFKLEFTKLAAAPYNSSRHNAMPPMTYRMFPTWVDEAIQQLTLIQDKPLTETEDFKTVSRDLINLGVVQPTVTKLTPEVPVTLLKFIKENTQSTVLAEYQTWENPDTVDTSTPILAQTINIFPNDLYLESLINSIDQSDYQTALLMKTTSTGTFVSENPLVPKVMATLASSADRTLIEEEKTFPDLWFPRRCRHGYKIVQSPRETQIAYYVAIREVKFYRRNQTAVYDDDVYFETLADTNNILTNTFVSSDWRYVISASTTLALGENNIVTFGNESFNGVIY